jgi:CubicO group peptidase (beta-lactamase class C family)
MMQHTSGLKDWGSVAAIAGWPRTTKTYSNTDALEIIARQQTLNHPPGEEYLYSNSNYNLFAIIVERVSGKSLADFTTENLFIPAGMRHTEWRNNFRKVVPNRAIAYSFEGGRFYTDMPNENVYGNGGLLTTSEDLLAWNNFYTQGKLGQPSLFPKQIATSPFNNGKPGSYGAGLRIDTLRGWKIIAHGGATASYRANLDYFPDLGLSIAWLSNTSQFDGDPLPAATAVRNLLVPNTSNDTKIGGIKQAISDSALFRDLKDGYARKLPVINGKPVDAPEGNWVPVGAAKTDSKSLQEFVGTYYSSDAAVQLKIEWINGKLVAHINPSNIHPLTPVCRDGFKMASGFIHFTRNAKGKLIGAAISVNRARNVPFTKSI